VFRHFGEIAAIQLLGGALTIVFGLGLGIGWSWSRRASQIIMGLWAVAFALLAVAMATMVDGLAGPHPLVRVFFAFWLAMALVTGLMWATAAALPVWMLERPAATEWFTRRAR
jgi:hypothetical protein